LRNGGNCVYLCVSGYSMSDILQEFEELLRLRDYYAQGNKVMHDTSFSQIKEALGDEYAKNIDEKIERWVNVTKVEYFYNKLPIVPYFEAKMLFRDGYFESVVSMCRIICEMICVEIIKNTTHPFGATEDIEQESFRVLLKFSAIPKRLTTSEFDKITNELLLCSDEMKLFKSSYSKCGSDYCFKIENGRTAKNLNKLIQCFEKANHLKFDHFSSESYKYLNEVYDLASDYLHGREKGDTEAGSLNSLDKIGFVLFELYGVKNFEELIGKTIETAYTKFPKIHTGTNFWITFYPTPEAALKASKGTAKKKNNR
jgi:hypothetical protein